MPEIVYTEGKIMGTEDVIFCDNCNQSRPEDGKCQVIGGKRYCSACLTMLESERTRECPFCGASIETDAGQCKHCGEFLDGRVRLELTQRKPPQKKQRPPLVSSFLGWIIAIVIAIVLLTFLFGYMGC